MHTRLPDKRNVAKHFCLSTFLSEQSFQVCLYVLLFFCCYFVVFQGYLAASSKFNTAVDIVNSYTQGFFCK